MTGAESAHCQVWVADLAMERPAHRDLLSADDARHRQSLHLPVDRSRFTIGVVLTRLVAGAATGIPADRVQIVRHCPRCGGAHGKPHLHGHGLHHSVSHAGDLVLLAMTAAGPVGVDVEPLGADHHGLPVDLLLHPTELLAAPGDLLTYWCRKESAAKADGRGMFASFSEIGVGRPDRAPVLSGPDGRRRDGQMFDLQPRPGYRGALTVLTTASISVSLADAMPVLLPAPTADDGPPAASR